MNIGLVMSGGMAKGAYQVGALKAINEFFDTKEIEYISCSSIASFNGYAFVNNKLDVAQKLWQDICPEGNNRLLVNSIMKSSNIQEIIGGLYSPKDKFGNNLYVSLMDIKHRAITYNNLSKIDSKLYPLYLKASVAFPMYNRPVKIGEHSYYDGAFIDNIPIYPLLKHNLDYIICIYFDDCCYTFENTFVDNRIIKINFPGKKSMVDSLSVNRKEVDRMIETGYKKTKSILSTVFANGTDNLEYIYDSIQALNNKSTKHKLYISADVLMTNFNKLTNKLAKKKINF